MGIITRYVLRQVAIPSVLAVVVVAVLGVANEIQERSSRLPMAQMTFGDISRLGFYFLPTIIPYLVPITYMLGILLAFGRFSQNNEIVAMKAAGIPLKRIVVPIIVIGGILSGLCFFIQDRMQPWAVDRMFEMVNSELPLRATFDVLPTGVMQEFGDWRVYIGRKTTEVGKITLHDIIVVVPEEEGFPATYYADSASLATEGGQSWLCMNSAHLVPSGKSGQVIRTNLDSIRLPIPKIATAQSNTSRQQFTLSGLYASISAKWQQVIETKSEPLKLELRKEQGEFADRLTMPFACLAVCFAAAPLGARAKRSGRSYTFAVGFLLVLVYYVLQMIVTPNALLPLWVALLLAWIPNILFFIAGCVLVWRVDRV
jgi:lipopolysaccharide export system permease protein